MSKTLGIFVGPLGEYNSLILKSLVTGNKQTIQLAEDIYLNQNDAPTQVNQSEVNQIHSTICQEDSSLEELAKKGYIRRENDLWKLELKGFCVALTLFNDPADVKKLVDFKQMNQDLQNIIGLAGNHPLIILASYRIENDSEFREWFLLQLKLLTEHMFRQGMNLDALSKREFQVLMADRMYNWMVEGFNTPTYFG